MTNKAAKKIFAQMIEVAAAKGAKDTVAKIELAREYLTNEAFRTNLQNHLWETRR